MKKSWTIIRCYLFIVASLVACLLLFGCKTQYVPVVENHTEYVHIHDTIKQTDSVKTNTNTIIRESRPEDSLMLAELGIKLKANERLLILLQRELTEKNKEKIEIHSKDSVRDDSVQVPYPVERKLSRWEQIKMDCGGIAIGGVIITVIILAIQFIRWLRRRDK